MKLNWTLYSFQAERNKQEQSPDVAAATTEAADEDERSPELDEDKGVTTETGAHGVDGTARG